MDKQYDDELKGFLWHENGATIERKGSFQINGKKLYGAICKSINDKGEEKYEFMQSLGLIHLNTEKKSEKSPDMGGKVTYNNTTYKLGCWAKESASGTPYTSLGFTPEVTQSDEQPSGYTNTTKPTAAF